MYSSVFMCHSYKIHGCDMDVEEFYQADCAFKGDRSMCYLKWVKIISNCRKQL